MMQHVLDFPNARTLAPDFAHFPSTRYQGSKRKLLAFIHAACSGYNFSSVLDLYSGTSSVALLFRQMGKFVTANDYLLYNCVTGKVLLGTESAWLESLDIAALVARAFGHNGRSQTLVRDNYAKIYFTDLENEQIDNFCANLIEFEEEERDLLIYLMGQAMLMKRPYNLFHRANLDMRLKDVPRTFGNAKTWETPFYVHMEKLGGRLKKLKFVGPKGNAQCLNTGDLENFSNEPDFIYLDPPYLNAKNMPVDYSSFYHFLDGIVDYPLFAKGNMKYPYKPIALKESRWKTAAGGLVEIDAALERWPNAQIAISYRGDGYPSIEALKDTLVARDYSISEHTAIDYKYALSKGAQTTEELIIGTPPSRVK